MTTPSLEVFWVSGSPYSWGVLLALELKGVAYRSCCLETDNGDLDAPAFRRLNPRGDVPTLRDGDFVISDSLAILAYLDREYREPPFFGRTSREAGAIWSAILRFTSYFVPSSKGIVKALYANEENDNPAEIAAQARVVRRELVGIEAAFAEGPWFMGECVSAADIALYPFLKSLFRAAAKPEAKVLALDLLPLRTRYPSIFRWMSRVEALAGYEATYPPGWKT